MTPRAVSRATFSRAIATFSSWSFACIADSSTRAKGRAGIPRGPTVAPPRRDIARHRVVPL
jgi:hypothetical protein